MTGGRVKIIYRASGAAPLCIASISFFSVIAKFQPFWKNNRKTSPQYPELSRWYRSANERLALVIARVTQPFFLTKRPRANDHGK